MSPLSRVKGFSILYTTFNDLLTFMFINLHTIQKFIMMFVGQKARYDKNWTYSNQTVIIRYWKIYQSLVKNVSPNNANTN